MRLFLFLAFRGLGCLMGMENWHWRWDGGWLGWTDVWGGYTMKQAGRASRLIPGIFFACYGRLVTC